MAKRLDGTAITEAFIQQMNEGSNWVERRDAATALTLMARQALLALRKTSDDKDPDVSHECKKSVATISSDLTASPQNLDVEIAGALRAYHADRGSATVEAGSAVESKAAGAGGASPAASSTTKADLEGWLREIARAQGGELREANGQWAIEFKLDGDRKQTIFVDPERKDSSGHEVAVMYTLCGPAEPKVFGMALQTNAQLSHAAFGVIKQGEKRLLVLMGRRRIAELTRATVEEILEYLAKKGDRAESQLQANDEH